MGGIESFSDSPQSQISKSSQLSVKSYVEMAINNLEHAIKLIEHNDDDDDDDDDELDPVQTETVQNSPKIGIHFLLNQLKCLIAPKFGRRYSIITQVFALKIHSISPACFRLVQSSNCLILPHERNLLKIKNSIGLENEYFSVMKEFSSTFNDKERHVLLAMDEVHIRSDASYKGGRIIGSIKHPEDPPTTVFSMMVTSLMTKFSTIVRLIPLGSSSATGLFPIITKTISDIENCNILCFQSLACFQSFLVRLCL